MTEKASALDPAWAWFSDDALLRCLFTEADQLPMEFAREVLSRGERVVPALADVLRHEYNWCRTDAGWCAVVHATYLLGAIGGDGVIEPLMDALRLAEMFEEDWIVEELPSIFGRLGPKAVAALCNIDSVACGGWMLKHTVLSCIAAVALRFPKEEEKIFRLIATVAEDEGEDDDARVWAGKILLDFGRAEYKGLLLNLAAGLAKRLYNRSAVERKLKRPNVARYTRDWMRFYAADQLSKRRLQAERERLSESRAWREALSVQWGVEPGAAEAAQTPYDGPEEEPPENALLWEEPRRMPGRNAFCPCGSGKRFKRCCMNRAVGRA